jgi:hypothetical protein
MAKRVRLTQIDGKLPNLALMRLASWHRDRGDEVVFRTTVDRDLLEPAYDVVYGSAIFTDSASIVDRLKEEWPGAIVGGTGSGSAATVEDVVGAAWERCDYSAYPDYRPSLGFTARGCRMRCKFCVVPGKEGKPRAVNTVADIWRGEGHPRRLHLLDNDFFGQSPADWQARIAEIQGGGFKVCFNQGVNIRLITDETAAALASVEYRDDQFRERRLYTAWDNLKDEKVFFRGVERLERAGVPPKHLMAYMLVGFDPAETMERVLYRFNHMVALGIRPYPMVYQAPLHSADRYRMLKRFQRWAVTGLYRAVAFDDYDANRKKATVGGGIQQAFDFAQPGGAA